MCSDVKSFVTGWSHSHNMLYSATIGASAALIELYPEDKYVSDK